MRMILCVVALLFCIVVMTPPLAGARADAEVGTVRDRVLALDPDVLLTALRTPIADDALPRAFRNATYLDPDAPGSDEIIFSAGDIANGIGSANFLIDYVQTGHHLNPADGATPVDDVSRRSASLGYATLNYVVLDDPSAADRVQDMRASFEDEIAGLGTPEPGISEQARIGQTTIGGTDALLITYVWEQKDIRLALQIVAVPVGNVVVVGVALFASTETDPAAVQKDAEALTLAGIAHLGEVAEEAA